MTLCSVWRSPNERARSRLPGDCRGTQGNANVRDSSAYGELIRAIKPARRSQERPSRVPAKEGGEGEREKARVMCVFALVEMKAALENGTWRRRCDRVHGTQEVSSCVSGAIVTPLHLSAKLQLGCVAREPRGEPCVRCVDRARSAHARAWRYPMCVYVLDPFDHCYTRHRAVIAELA